MRKVKSGFISFLNDLKDHPGIFPFSEKSYSLQTIRYLNCRNSPETCRFYTALNPEFL
jgi:hypothetical protein